MSNAGISKETIKTFLILFCVAGLGILSLNTYMMVKNQERIIDNQENKGLPLSTDNNQRIKNIEDLIENCTLAQQTK